LSSGNVRDPAGERQLVLWEKDADTIIEVPGGSEPPFRDVAETIGLPRQPGRTP